jgi:hypothetical protein
MSKGCVLDTRETHFDHDASILRDNRSAVINSIILLGASADLAFPEKALCAPMPYGRISLNQVHQQRIAEDCYLYEYFTPESHDEALYLLSMSGVMLLAEEQRSKKVVLHCCTVTLMK